MIKHNIPTYILGIELKKDCPRGTRTRLVRWLWYNSEKQLKKNVYLLNRNKYWLWSEYYDPLVKMFGISFAYQTIIIENDNNEKSLSVISNNNLDNSNN